MKQFLSRHLLKELFLEKIALLADKNNNEKTLTHGGNTLIEEPLIQKIVNLPDKLANFYNSNMRWISL